MPKRSSIQTADLNQAAAQMITADSGPIIINGKNVAAVLLGRLGGKKGGLARAAKLSSKRRRAIARKAAEARWKKKA